LWFVFPLPLPSLKSSPIKGLFPLLTLIGVGTALLVSHSTLNQQDGWRICVAVPVLPSLVILVTLVFVPESPVWLIAHKTPMGWTTSRTLAALSDSPSLPVDGFVALEKYRPMSEVLSGSPQPKTPHPPLHCRPLSSSTVSIGLSHTMLDMITLGAHSSCLIVP
jgi:hypothetical protein